MKKLKPTSPDFDSLPDDRKRGILKTQINVETRRLYDLMSKLREVETLGFDCSWQSGDGKSIVVSAKLAKVEAE